MKTCPFLSGLMLSTFSPITSGVIVLSYNKQHPLSRIVNMDSCTTSFTVCLQQVFKLMTGDPTGSYAYAGG